MNIVELAKEYGWEATNSEGFYLEHQDIEAFAQAIIEDYKASLVPVAYQALCGEKNYALSTSKVNLDGHHTDFWQRQLYALPSGETK